MFMIPGSNNVIRVNGLAKLTADEAMRQRFERKGILPATVAIIRIREVYSQCARALMRSRTWSSGDESEGLPSIGDMLRDVTEGRIDGEAYDAEWPGRAARSLW